MIDATQVTLEKALDLSMRRHAVHSSNIANANVPGYKAKRIDFNDQLKQALGELEQPNLTQVERNTRAVASLKNLSPDVYEDPNAPMRGDGNTVNIDQEQVELAKNTIFFEGSIALLNKKIAMQKYALSEGGSR